mgnify:CR=1 FL=1
MFKRSSSFLFNMDVNRIVSFLPSATELLYEFGVEEKLFGVTHECKYPETAKLKPQVISSVINSDELTSNEINTITCTLLRDGKNIFELNEKNLLNANPDLIISQETCEVCAAYTNEVKNALDILPIKPKLYSMDPHNLNEIIESVTHLGKILQKEKKASDIVISLHKRIQNIQNSQNKIKPKILAIEWIEPFFTAGHWIPEMIELAGGINLISKTGEHSRRMDMIEVEDSNPDIIILWIFLLIYHLRANEIPFKTRIRQTFLIPTIEYYLLIFSSFKSKIAFLK